MLTLTIGSLVSFITFGLLSGPTSGSGGDGSTTSSTTTTTSTPPTTTSTTLPDTTTTDPGQLPQTATKPPSSVGALNTRFAPLFAAIQTGNESAADALFFPRSAYVSMKTGTLANPTSDYDNRLFAFYHLDLAAYRAALGPHPGLTSFLGVNATPSYAGVIPAHACENNVAYWHLPGIRLVYKENEVVKSFSIASLISWRGVWYVVHLGPNPRPSNVGTVDQPSAGVGVPGPPGGC